MADKSLNFNDNLVQSPDKFAPQSSPRNTLLTIILVLLLIIVIVIIYNYWTIYSYSYHLRIDRVCKTDPLVLNENFSNSNSSSDSNSSSGSSSGLAPIVGSTVSNIPRYDNGSIRPEIKHMMQQQTSRKTQQASGQSQRESQTGQNSNDNSNGNNNASRTDKNQQSKIKDTKKTDTPSPDVVKFIVYHMQGCGHCHDIMSVKQSNGSTKFEEIQKIFASDPRVQIIDFQYGRDKEASKYNSFPVVKIVKVDGDEEYNGPRDVQSMTRFIMQKSNMF